MNSRIVLLTKKDIILIIAIFLIGAALFGINRWMNETDSDSIGEYGRHMVYAEITSEFGVYNVYLDYEQTFSVTMLPNIVFEVSGGQIAFIKSDCPDQVCVRAGFLNRSGQMAVCLPNRVILHIQSMRSNENSNDFDIFVH